MLIRGVPVERYGKDARVVDLLGRRHAPRSAVAAEREGPPARRRHRPGQGARPTRRRAATRSAAIAFPFHSDGSDLVGLFCLDAGASGGASLVANAVTIHNELVRTEPELAAELYAPFPYDLRGEQAPGAQALVHDADLQPLRRPAVRALHPPVHRGDAPARRRARARRTRRARRWTASTRCAPIPQYHVSMTMQPGDMQFVNNYHVLHARDAYADDRADGQDPAPQAAVAGDRRARRRRQARALPPRPHRQQLLVEQGPDEERAPGLTCISREPARVAPVARARRLGRRCGTRARRRLRGRRRSSAACAGRSSGTGVALADARAARSTTRPMR